MTTSPANRRGIPTLTPLEQVGPRGYLRYLFLIALPADYDPDQVLGVLRAGWSAAAERIPELGCEVVPEADPATTQAGRVKLKLLPTVEQEGGGEGEGRDAYETIVARDLRDPAVFAHSYAELREQHFPLSAFEEALFARRDTWPRPGERLPVAAVQANFLRGAGLALQCCFFHVVGDWNSFSTWLEVWAEECRRAQEDGSSGSSSSRGASPSSPAAVAVDLSEAMFADRESVMRSSGRNPGRAEDHPEVTVLPFTPEDVPPKMRDRAHRGQLFYLSPENCARLKADAAPANATALSSPPSSDQAQAPEYVSTNDAIAALIWRAVMRAQHPHLLGDAPEEGGGGEGGGGPVSVCNVAIDGRRRTDPAVHPRTLGCFLTWTAARLPIRAMLAESTAVADVALAIRRALGPVGRQWVDDVTALAEGLGDASRLVATAFLDVPGNHCAQTSWVGGSSPYVYSWGEGGGAAFGGGRIEAVRTLDVGVINGGQVILPKLPDGAIEFIVGVDGSCLERLLEDPWLGRYCQARVLRVH